MLRFALNYIVLLQLEKMWCNEEKGPNILSLYQISVRSCICFVRGLRGFWRPSVHKVMG